MKQLNLLQNRINELNSAIINIIGNKVHVTGFYNPKMLKSHLDSGNLNYQSKGIYDIEEINFNDVLNNSLFVILENGIEQKRIQFEQVFKDILKINDSSKKEIVTIRKDIFSHSYVLKTEKYSSTFNNLNALNHFLEEKYQTKLSNSMEVIK